MTNRKYHGTKFLSIAGIPLLLWIVGRIQESGLSGDSTAAKRWFIFLVGVVIIEIPIVLTFYYSRSALKHKNPDAVAMETLATSRDTERKQ